MCGFVGILGYGSDLSNRELLRRMRDTLTHRGPDDAGEFFDTDVALGFRRLAILDLSSNAHQPMSNAAGNLWIVFNGEIYNHVELRAELVNLGYSFRSQSDTEVLLALYERLGTRMFDRINGMFTFAIYDKKRRWILLARDRMGVKPLYYWQNGNQLAFASELKALRLLPDFPRTFDPTALAMYMRLNFVPGATSIFPGVKKVPPAHYVSIALDKPVEPVATRYWQIDWEVECEEHSESSWLERIDELLHDAVRIRLRSDVPLGTFLSGGIDSGLVTAVAARILGSELRAFTVGFPGTDADETENARATAEQVGISILVEILQDDTLQLFPELESHFDEPFCDMSLIPTYQLCRKMRAHATVILSGDGGDELFGGYQYHPIAWRMRHLDAIPDAILQPLLRGVALFAPEGSRIHRNSRRLALPARVRGAFYQRDVCETWQDKVLRREYVIPTMYLVGEMQRHHELGRGRTALDRAQAGDLQLLLPDNMLLKVDRMSMKASVEVRSPFLDYRFAELIPKIPPALKVRNGQTKYLLRRLAERYLPNRIAHGPKKGFDISPAQWLAGDRKRVIREWFFQEDGKNSIVKLDGLDWLWRNLEKHPSHASAVLRIAAWNLWADRNGTDV